mmetsp:Transcript_30043/g.61360  ORF Transcript_30043/g.61360 Transcript_30043/m.61360 type:complete len:262 (-) Transcript_30043:49-834(-)
MRTGLRTLRRLRRTIRRGMHHQTRQGTRHRIPSFQRRHAQMDDRRGIRRPAHPRTTHRPHGRLARQPPSHGSRLRSPIRRNHRNRHGPNQGTHPRPPQRSRRLGPPLGSGRRQNRRSLPRILHDQHRTLPRGGKTPRRSTRGEDASHQTLGGTPDQNGRGATHQGGILFHLRHRRGEDGNAGMFALHGKSGQSRTGMHGGLDVHEEFPESARAGGQRLFGQRGIGGRGEHRGEVAHGGGVYEVHGQGGCDGGGYVSVFEFR